MDSRLAPLVRAYARWWTRRVLTRECDGLYVEGLDELRRACSEGPVIIAANHQAFWDGVVAVALNTELGLDGSILMDEGRLSRFPFFAAAGAIPISTSGALANRRHLARAQQRLGGPGQVTWVFPQGSHTSPRQRPLGLHRGVQLLARRSSAPVVPVSIQYEFRERPVPRVFLRVHSPVSPTDPALMSTLEAALVEGLDRPPHPDAEPLLGGQDLLPDDWATRALAWLWRRFEVPVAELPGEQP